MPDSSPAGWFPDPFRRHERRYWDGSQWTHHVASYGRQSVDAPGGSPVPAGKAVPSPAAWFQDPFGRHERRYWDGSQWTHHVGSHGRQEIDPPGDEMPPSTSATEQRPADWHRDPSRQQERRYWNGTQWTDLDGSGRREEIHPAIDHTATPTIGRPSKKVQRQVRRAGAEDGKTGGETLFTEQVLVINQKAKLFGSTLGYAVYNQNGQQIGTVQEIRRDLATIVSDRLHRHTDSTRTHRFQIVDMSNRVLLAMTRPELVWFQMKGKLVIEGGEGAPIGQIVHESFGLGGSIATAAQVAVGSASTIAWLGLGGVTGMLAGTALGGVQDRLNSAVDGLDKVGHARFGLETGGQRIGSVHAESTKQWDFYVQDVTGNEVARITKSWAGWAKERFTKSDNYVVQMHRPLEDPLRSLVIAAALAIDVELKQRGDQTRGSSVWGTRKYK